MSNSGTPGVVRRGAGAKQPGAGQSAGQHIPVGQPVDTGSNDGIDTQAHGVHRIGLGAIRQSLRTNNSRRSVGEIVARYRDAMDKALADQPGIKLYVMDGVANSLRLSSLLVVLPFQLPSGQQLVSVYTMLIEASNAHDRALPTRDVMVKGRSIQVPLVPGDIFNDNYRQKVLSAVAVDFPDADVRSAHAMVIYKHVDPNDAVRMKEIAFYGVEACIRTLDLLTGDLQPFVSLAQFDETDRVKAFINYNPIAIQDSCGNPIRADMCIEVTAEPAVQADKLNPESFGLTRVYGYIETVYRQPDQQYGPQGQLIPYRYVPRFNITRIVCDADAETLELRLFGIYTAMVLAVGDAWAAPLRPIKQGLHDDSINLRDITAIGYEVPAYAGPDNIRQRVQPKEGTIFTDRDLITLIREAFQPDSFSIALHIEECGEMSWMDSVLFRAAERDTVSIEVVLRALNRLTNNEFSKHFDHNKHTLFYVDNNRIVRGYREHLHTKYDLLEMDSLAMLNLIGHSDIEKAIEFSEAFASSQILDADQRMAQVMDIEREYLGETMHVTGYGVRVIPSAELLYALDRSLAALKFNINPENVFNNASFGQRSSAIADISRVGIASSSLSGVFSNNRANTVAGGPASGLTWGVQRRT